MSLNSALSIAAGGLANINAQFALISQNVANAATPGYAVETSNQQALTADGVGMGVLTGPATLQIDQALQIIRDATERHGHRPADHPDGVADDRQRARHARFGQRHRQPAGQPAKQFFDPADRSEQPDAAKRGGGIGDNPRPGDQHAQRGLCDAAPGGAERSAIGGHHAECDAGDDRPAQRPDHRPAADQPEHRRSAKPAERGGADIVATAVHQDGGATQRRPVDLHLQRPDAADTGRRHAVLDGEFIDRRRIHLSRRRHRRHHAGRAPTSPRK